MLGNLGQEISQTSGEQVADTIIADDGDGDIDLPVLDEEIAGAQTTCCALRSTRAPFPTMCLGAATYCQYVMPLAWAQACVVLRGRIPVWFL